MRPKRDEFVFLRIIEGRVQGLGRLDHLLEICPALREAVRLRDVMRSIGDKLSPCSFCRATTRTLPPSLTADFKRPPKLFLVGGQPKAGLHALELGVESRLRPALHELGVRGLLIALRRGRDRETESGEGGCSRRGCKSPKESAFQHC